MGVAIFDHPSNPRHPTRWHVRAYGLYAANPFCLKGFNKNLDQVGDFKLASGEKATFRYLFVFHFGDTQSAAIDQRYVKFAAQP